MYNIHGITHFQNNYIGTFIFPWFKFSESQTNDMLVSTRVIMHVLNFGTSKTNSKYSPEVQTGEANSFSSTRDSTYTTEIYLYV